MEQKPTAKPDILEQIARQSDIVADWLFKQARFAVAWLVASIKRKPPPSDLAQIAAATEKEKARVIKLQATFEAKKVLEDTRKQSRELEVQIEQLTNLKTDDKKPKIRTTRI